MTCNVLRDTTDSSIYSGSTSTPPSTTSNPGPKDPSKLQAHLHTLGIKQSKGFYTPNNTTTKQEDCEEVIIQNLMKKKSIRFLRC